ncbi:MAG: transposase [Sterolibacteriaceae bacterium]|uniref:Transposase n=1 Tax=Candidatus Methylophosphatis roskildensis TaxID=2899263 RepID=A0A9D7E2I9_9PROT|nr:transposase [Candidatus Methylophosphatis roskildensis]MBK7235937.1 transposase [Sterolibacteriaceae bacterium]
MKYRRSLVASGTFFFTVNLADRQSDLLVAHVESLRSVVRLTRQRHPFEIVAMVVLPDHLHAIWRLPENDTDYPTRWSLIKAGFSRRLAKSESIGASRLRKRERGIWQRRYWEHQIRDDDDLDRHVAYVHFNPVKHGYVERAIDWPYSSIHRYVGEGAVSETWGTK